MFKTIIYLFLCLFCQNWIFAGINPDAALESLLAGNKRYVEDKLIHPDRTSERREAVIAKQKPFAVIVGCSDSRVSPEILFDQGVGDLFVVRVAGNVVGPLELDSIEYAIKYLGSSLVVVLGHQNCGAVKAVLNGDTKDIEAIAELIDPALEQAKNAKANKLEIAVQDNVKNVATFLKQSPLLKQMLAKRSINIVGGYYTLETGQVTILKE